MSAVDVIAVGAISALGRGDAAFSPGAAGELAPSAIERDAELAAAGLRKPFAARARIEALGCRASALLGAAARELARELDGAWEDWRALRVGLVVGTSGGGMPSLVQALAALDRGQPITSEIARAAPYFGPLSALDELGVKLEPRAQVLAACASSTFALGIACRWLDHDRADLVIAGGYDALSVFIAAGFECLGATSERPLPFRRARDGLALGEGAALLALCCPRAGLASRGRILGFGAATDAVHVTAPDRTGAGLARAATRALEDAGASAESIGLLSAHGTATSYNDAAEAQAIESVLGLHARAAIVHAFKASIGHTLGAAGALETLAACKALELGLAPATSGFGEVDPALAASILDRGRAGDPGRCFKLSSAFGGANAALVLEAGTSLPRHSQRSPRRVRVLSVGPQVTLTKADALAPLVATDKVKLARMDELSLLVVSAAAPLAPLPEPTAVIVGTATATLDIDADFERRSSARGAESRRFPATSPNLCAGECSIAFGLRGPSFSVGAGPAASIEALVVAHDLIAAGDSDTALVVAAEAPGAFGRAIWTAAGWPPPAYGAVAIVLGSGEGSGEVDRAELARAWQSACEGGGGLDDRAPGAPSLIRALERVRT